MDNTLEVMGPNVWNKLNVEIMSSLTKGQFRYRYCKCYIWKEEVHLAIILNNLLYIYGYLAFFKN